MILGRHGARRPCYKDAGEGSIQIASALDAFLQRGGSAMFIWPVVPPRRRSWRIWCIFAALSDSLRQGSDGIERDGKATQLPITRGDAIFVPPNCWEQPAWAAGFGC